MSSRSLPILLSYQHEKDPKRSSRCECAYEFYCCGRGSGTAWRRSPELGLSHAISRRRDQRAPVIEDRPQGDLVRMVDECMIDGSHPCFPPCRLRPVSSRVNDL